MRTVLSSLLIALFAIGLSPAQDVQFAQHIDVSGDEKVYYNLIENRISSAQEAQFGAWDVAFQGTSVTVNGPSLLLGSTFDTVDVAPEEGYSVDEDGTSALPTDAETRWFNYDFNTHTITPKPDRTAVFQTRDGRWIKLNITDYYKVVFGQDPIPRMLSFRWVVANENVRSFQ
jgi:hypothetical protein